MLVLLRALFALFVLVTAAAAQDMRFFSIGSGSIEGGYYAAAQTICRAVNRAGGGIRCSPEPTSGSLYNLAALRDGQIDFALVQSDWHRIAYEGTDVFAKTGPMAEMRSVMSLYPEAVTVLARRGAGIKGPAELLGKRIDIGHPTSGRHATLRRILNSLEVSDSEFALVTQLTDGAAIEELCEGRLDAVLLIVGHPNAAVARALKECDIFIAPFTGSRIDAAFAAGADYVRTAIPRDTYPEIGYSVESYAVTATVVTMADTDPVLVGSFVARTLAALETLQAETRLFAQVKLRGMSARGLTAPLHPASAAAFDAFVGGGSITQ
jgi:TRAP transporter TAXI family solute receptor